MGRALVLRSNASMHVPANVLDYVDHSISGKQCNKSTHSWFSGCSTGEPVGVGEW